MSEQGSGGTVDLDTVREVLRYMHDDMQRQPGLAGVRRALSLALDEIEACEVTASPARPATESNVMPLRRARFVPWTPAG